jgi:hypothetical protein
MALPYEERNSAVKTRRQQEDQRRMEFRRAIEDRCERRQLLAEIGDFPEDPNSLLAGCGGSFPSKRSTSALICTRSLRMNARNA